MSRLEEAEAAVGALFDPSSGEDVRGAATNFLKQAVNGIESTLHFFSATSNPTCQFWALQALIDVVKFDYLGLSEFERAGLQHWLVGFSVDEARLLKLSPFNLNKLAQLYVQVLRMGYPSEWSNGLRDLVQEENMRSTVLSDMCMRILLAFDDEFVSVDFVRSAADLSECMRIKDDMRSNGDVVLVLRSFRLILSRTGVLPQSVVASCLTVASRFIPWVDTQLALDHLLQSLIKLLEEASVLAEVATCLLSFVNKKMEVGAKVSVLQLMLGDMRVWSASVRLAVSTDGQAEENVSALITAMCRELLFAVEAGHGEMAVAESLLGGLMSQYVECLSSDDDGSTESALEFLPSFVSFCKKKQALSSNEVGFLAAVLRALRDKMRWTTDAVDEDEEGEFMVFRRSLSANFKNVSRLIPDVSKALVVECLQTILSSKCDYPYVEVSLVLVHEMGEIFNEAQLREAPDGTMCLFDMLMRLPASDLVREAHEKVHVTLPSCLQKCSADRSCQVKIAFLDVVVRYSKLWASGSADCIPRILETLLSTEFVCCANNTVRGRSCYQVLRLVKSVRNVVGATAPEIVKALLGFLGAYSFDLDERLHLLESVGVLVALSPSDSVSSMELLNAVTAPPLARLQAAVSDATLYSATPEGALVAASACASVQELQAVSKGFARAGESQLRVWATCLNSVVHLAPAFACCDEVISRVCSFFHRMVELMGVWMLPCLGDLTGCWTPHVNCPGLAQLFTLYAQVALRIRRDAGDLIVERFPELIQAVLARETSEAGELGREFNEVKRTLFLFLAALGQHQMLMKTLLAPGSGPVVMQLLRLVVTSSVSSEDVQVQRTCVAILSRFCRDGLGAEQSPGIVNFVLESVVPATVAIPLQPHFSVGDAVTAALLTDVCQLHTVLEEALPDRFGAALCSSAGVGDVSVYIAALKDEKSSGKELRGILLSIFV